jgi:hypothetical protein
MGPMTGRGAGWCTGYAGREADHPTAGPGYGAGFGRRRAWGRGWCTGRFFGRGGGMRFGGYEALYGDPERKAPPYRRIEKQALANQAEALQSELEWVRKRLAEIESEPTPDQ